VNVLLVVRIVLHSSNCINLVIEAVKHILICYVQSVVLEAHYKPTPIACDSPYHMPRRVKETAKLHVQFFIYILLAKSTLMIFGFISRLVQLRYIDSRSIYSAVRVQSDHSPHLTQLIVPSHRHSLQHATCRTSVVNNIANIVNNTHLPLTQLASHTHTHTHTHTYILRKHRFVARLAS